MAPTWAAVNGKQGALFTIKVGLLPSSLLETELREHQAGLLEYRGVVGRKQGLISLVSSWAFVPFLSISIGRQGALCGTRSHVVQDGVKRRS